MGSTPAFEVGKTSMKYTDLGRTGLRVSVIGLGCGGPSRLGLSRGGSEQQALRTVERAIDLGINFIDLAGPVYGTDHVVRSAIQGRRDQIVLSTKVALGPSIGPFEESRLASRLSARVGQQISFVTSGHVIEDRLHASLRRLNTDYVDVLSLHDVTLGQFDAALSQLLPTLLRLQDAGKIRKIGLTEAFWWDPTHRVLDRAVTAKQFDTLMVGFNILNRSAEPIVRKAKRQGSGIVVMYVMRRALCNQQNLQRAMNDLAQQGLIPYEKSDAGYLMQLLKRHGLNLPEAALRFCRHELEPDVILTGTGDISHLEQNIAACQKERLPAVLRSELDRLFGPIDCITGA